MQEDRGPVYSTRKELWNGLKVALDGEAVAETFLRLDRLDEDPILLIAAAVHHLLSQPQGLQQALLLRYLASFAQPPLEQLPPEAASQLDQPFLEALERCGVNAMTRRR